MTTIYLPHVSGGNDARPTFDMVDYLCPPQSLIFEMLLIDGDGNQHQARHQCQYTAGDGAQMHWRLTKGNEHLAEYEEFYADVDPAGFIYRGYDTSPGNGEYYLLKDDGLARMSRWAPRRWSVGDVFERNPYVSFYRKSDCMPVMWRSGYHQTWLRFAAHHPRYEVAPGMWFDDVIELHWLLHDPADHPDQQPHERYWYAAGYGMVQWVGEIGHSYVVEIHEPGDRPDNKREVIPCL